MLSTSRGWFRSVSRGARVCFLLPALCFGNYSALTERQLQLSEREVPQNVYAPSGFGRSFQASADVGWLVPNFQPKFSSSVFRRSQSGLNRKESSN